MTNTKPTVSGQKLSAIIIVARPPTETSCPTTTYVRRPPPRHRLVRSDSAPIKGWTN